MSAWLSGTTVLVTGGTGCIGSTLMAQLALRGPGRLVGVSREAFKGLDLSRHGLAQVEHEVYMGFIFVRFAPGLPSVREMCAPYAHELAAHRLAQETRQAGLADSDGPFDNNKSMWYCDWH